MGGIIKCENGHFHGEVSGCPVCAEISLLEGLLSECEKAIGFYADEENYRKWKQIEYKGEGYAATPMGIDRGEKAKEFLSKIKAWRKE